MMDLLILDTQTLCRRGLRRANAFDFLVMTGSQGSLCRSLDMYIHAECDFDLDYACSLELVDVCVCAMILYAFGLLEVYGVFDHRTQCAEG